MTLEEYINFNIALSGEIGVIDADDLTDQNVIVFDSIKDKKLKKYYDWDIIRVYPVIKDFDDEKKIRYIFFWKIKKYKEEATITKTPMIVLVLCHHTTDVEETEAAEIPKNYK